MIKLSSGCLRVRNCTCHIGVLLQMVGLGGLLMLLLVLGSVARVSLGHGQFMGFTFDLGEVVGITGKGRFLEV